MTFEELLKALFQVDVIILIILFLLPLIGLYLGFGNSNPNVVFNKLKELCNNKNGAFSFILDLNMYDIHFKNLGSGKYKITLYSCKDYDFKKKSSISGDGVRNLSLCTKVDEFVCEVSAVKVDWSKLKCMNYDWGYYYEEGCDYFVGESCTPSFDNFSLGDFCYEDSCWVDKCYDSKKLQKSLSGQFVYSGGTLHIKINLVQ